MNNITKETTAPTSNAIMGGINNRLLVYLEVGRGLAALLVVCFHATGIVGLEKYFGIEPFHGMFNFGNAGVDFFFVLSGFIIYFSTSANHGNLRCATEYLKHRLARIYPIYWLVALFLLPIGLLFGHWPGIINIFNDFLLLPHEGLPFIPVAWTLSHEMMFYISFLLFFINRILAWAYFLSWGVFIGLANTLHLNHGSPLWELYLNLHNIEFVLGILVAAYIRQNGLVPFWCLFVGSILFLFIGLNASLFNTGITVAIPEYHLLYGASSVFLVAGFATTPNPGGMLLRAFVFLGRASYSIYLIHFAVLSAVIKLLVKMEMSLSMNFIILVISGVLFGSLLFQFAERPLMAHVKRQMNLISKNNH